MGHADSGTLMAYLDGELPVRDRSAIESHLGDCRPCAVELDELRAMASDLTSALALVDGSIPMLRARARIQPLVAADRRPAVLRMVPASLLKAAAVVLLLAGAGYAAIPGTPLNRLVESFVDGATAPIADRPDTAVVDAPRPIVAAPPAEDQRQPGTEFGVAPVAGRGRVAIHGPAADATIAVRLVDSAAIVRVIALGADDTRFDSGAGYIEVYENTTGLIIEVPRSIASMTVEVDGRLYFVKDGEQTRLPGPGTETAPGEFVFQTRSR